MKHFSKLAALLLGAAMIFAFAGCANSSDNPPETYTITINESENGSVTASKTTGITAGEKITLTVTPAYTDNEDYYYALSILSVKNGDADIAVSGSENSSTRTFVMPAANVTVSATFAKITYTYIGTKKPSQAKEVGDIVFNDGSAMPYSAFTALDETAQTEKKAAAIALIFYKGTGLNSGDDTTTSRTLGIGLKQGEALEWCTDYADAYSRNIKTIQCIPQGNAGALTFTGDKNGSDNLEQIGALKGINDTTGEEADERYPAFYFAKNYKNQKIKNETVSRIQSDSEYANAWYLPSLAELYQIYVCCKNATNDFDMDAAIVALGGDKFLGKGGLLSSSQSAYVDKRAYELTSYNGDFANIDKDDNRYTYICCIREFN